MIRIKKGVNKFLIRLKACWYILSGRYKRWLILNIEKDELIKLLQGDNFDVNILHHGTVHYTNIIMIKGVAASYDKDDILLEKIKFECDYDEYKKQKGGQAPEIQMPQGGVGTKN